VLGGVLAWELSDTKLDKGPNDTAERAQDWLTPTLVRQVTSFYATKSPGAAWSTWTRHHAWLRVALTLTNDDHRPDTTTTAVRQLLVQIAPTGRDSWTGTPSEHVDAVLLERTPAGWRLASLFSR
jgi:hypothetical protein